MIILIDSREQTPLDFSGYDCSTREAGLATGDYSLAGLETIAAIERKSENDLLGSLTQGRERFERELARLRGFSLKAVVCETSWQRLARGEYRSRMTAHSCLQSILGLSVRYDLPFLMVETRKAAAYTIFHLFRHFLEQRERELKAILKNCPNGTRQKKEAARVDGLEEG